MKHQHLNHEEWSLAGINSCITLPEASLFDLGGLQVDLEELLGVPVDLVTPGDLPENFRNFVLKEARKI